MSGDYTKNTKCAHCHAATCVSCFNLKLLESFRFKSFL